MKSSMEMILMMAMMTLFEIVSPRRGVGTVKEGRKVADAEESA